MQAYPLHRRVLHGAWVRLERSAVKVARCVLRGLGEGDLAWLPGGFLSFGALRWAEALREWRYRK